MQKAEQQCQCLTAKGTQCTRLVQPPALYCWQHKNCKTPVAGSTRKISPKKSVSTRKPVSPRKYKQPAINLNETLPVGRFLTGDPNVDILILLGLDDTTLASTCRTNKYAKLLCNDENFWRQKVERLPIKNKAKPVNKTWKEYYRRLTATVTVGVEFKPGLPNARTIEYRPIFNIKLTEDMYHKILVLHRRHAGRRMPEKSIAKGYMEENLPGLSGVLLEQFRQHPEYFTDVEVDEEDPSHFMIQPTQLYFTSANWDMSQFNPNGVFTAVMRYNFNQEFDLSTIRIEPN